MTYSPIPCADYDQYELWCMQNAELLITLHSGEQLQGKAVNLKIIHPDGEHLIITTAKGEHNVRLDLITSAIVV
ncbi:Rho-binding antiterminator [Pseudoalteromonas sp. CF6-2]|uniref:Rho-binding antiterminator n=1 Tax=Pseudoalteromonas sp. CF6-2 TaxID=562716 RepID=UPI0018801115|nr:Rho-binding antiterminator [Lelliottia steviae]UJX26024.1 Rho-binding antiterminator [Pseudoalteromonas sp. CF6-2]